MEKTGTDARIDEAFNVAVQLGVSFTSNVEEDTFRKALQRIAVYALDEARHGVEQYMHEMSDSYTLLRKEE